MTKHTSTYPGTLVMPDGTEVKLGGDVTISADLAKNEGVAGWIGSGWLVPMTAKAAQPVMPTGKK
jgi:hypothetical protein